MTTVFFKKASFAWMNEKAQDLVVYSTNDASWNEMTLTITNDTGVDLNLIGGEPVIGSKSGAASSFSFDFGIILTAAETSAMSVEETTGTWGALYFAPAPQCSPTWSVAPKKDLVLKSGEKVVFKLGGITCASHLPGYLDMSYHNVPQVTPRDYPFTYQVTVLNPPQGLDLKSVIDCGVLNESVYHIIDPVSFLPPGGSGTMPIPIDITYDNAFQIKNSFTVFLKNTSKLPLIPPNTKLGGAVFIISFLFANNDDNAITTPDLIDKVSIDVDTDSFSKWSSPIQNKANQCWIITPLSQWIIPSYKAVNFPIGGIVTALNANPQTLSSMHIQWNFIPGYADGHFSIELQKQLAIPNIPHGCFQVTPSTITVGQNVSISYRTEVAAYVTLSYERRDGSQVNLSSPSDIGFDESDYELALPPDKEMTVFTLSVFRGPGQSAVDIQTRHITVNQLPAAITTFTSSSRLVNINGSNIITLSWQVQNAKTIEVNGVVQTGESMNVTIHATTTYTLKATPWGSNGQPVSESLTIYAYKTYPSLNVGPMGDGTTFQSLPISISNRWRRMVYVANAKAGCVYQVMQATHAVSPSVYSGNILSQSADELKLFTAQHLDGPGSIFMNDTGTPGQVLSIPQPGPPPYSMAISPSGTQMYYLQQHNLTTVSAYSVNEAGNSFAYVKDITVGKSPEAYAFDTAGANLYVGNYDSKSVSVINLASNSVVATIELESSEPCAFALVGDILFIACSGDNLVCVIDIKTNKTLDPITAGFQPFSLTLDQNKARLFVTNFQGGTVTVIDTVKRTVISTLTVGNGPSAAKITDSGALMFVSNYCDKSLTVVDISGGDATVVGSIPLEQTNGNPIDISTYPEINNYTDVFVAKEYFSLRNNGCSQSKATDENLNMSIFSIQEKSGALTAHTLES